MKAPWSWDTGGIDEVGRGPLAGPVVAAAVVLGDRGDWHELVDSKSLAPGKRQRLSAMLKRHATAWSIGEATASEVDRYNIRKATLMAMKRAMDGLDPMPMAFIVDGLDIPDGTKQMTAMVGADSQVPAVAAASIIAKVYRDTLMEKLDQSYPGYGFARNKGYASVAHRAALMEMGPCPAHRRSFAPVREALQTDSPLESGR
jgi:ribonuclease HII